MIKMTLPYDGDVDVYDWKEGCGIIQEELTTASFKFKGRGKRRKKYYNLICGFDIETSTVVNNKWEPKQAEMYHRFSYTFCWQFMVNGKFVFGRDPKEFFQMLKAVSCSGLIIIYVHNLTYEYNNLADFFKGSEIFFKSGNTPLFIRYGAFEFRDSAQLTHKSLAMLGQEIGYEKLKGDFDYNTERGRKTKLTTLEMNYCYRDVKILDKYIRQEAINYTGEDNPYKLPFTQTGYVRNDMKEFFSHTKLGNLMLHETELSLEDYTFISRSFYGGFTHSNFRHVGEEIKEIYHGDITSAYPASFVIWNYPYKLTKAKHLMVDVYMERLKDENIAQIATVRFANIVLKKGGIPFAPYSELGNGKKSYGYNAIEENGRLMCANVYQVTLCDVDMNLLLENYTFESMELMELYYGYKRRLPKPVVDVILKYFNGKTTLKGIEGKDYEYLLSKQKLNGIYGLSATALIHSLYEVGEDLEVKVTGNEYKPATVMPYQWAVYCTAYVRKAVYGLISKLPDKDLFIYSDTDSVFCKKSDIVDNIVKEYNADIIKRLQELEKDYPNIMPKNPKGQTQYLGTFTDECDDCTGFCTIGAKRYYIKHSDGTVDLTVSGLTATKVKKVDGVRVNGNNTQRLLDLFDGDIHKCFTAVADGKSVNLPFIEGQDKLSNYNTRYPYEGYLCGELVSTSCSYTLYPVDTTLSLNGSIRKVLAHIANGGEYDIVRDEIY